MAALATTIAMASGASPAKLCGAPFGGALLDGGPVVGLSLIGVPLVRLVDVVVVPIEVAPQVDASWHHANHLAWVIEHRRYGEIDDAVAEIAQSSPYARWVPAAVGLAIEQLDATARAYADMGRCEDLARFRHRLGQEWPRGKAAMKPVTCEGSFVCGTYKTEMIRELGGIEAYRRVTALMKLERFTERTVEIETAAAAGDHARALAICSDISKDGPMLATCVAEACRAGELAIAEALLPAADPATVRACNDAGVSFVDGFASAPSGHKQPVELVRVHPDAPPRHDLIIDW